MGRYGSLIFTRFHPLYRGTWFPTSFENGRGQIAYQVSIRYIAVLGFQPSTGYLPV